MSLTMKTRLCRIRRARKKYGWDILTVDLAGQRKYRNICRDKALAQSCGNTPSTPEVCTLLCVFFGVPHAGTTTG